MSENAYQNILDRVSVKKYKPDPVPEELVEKILAAGLAAPSGVNMQGTYLLVATGEKRDLIAKLNAAVMNREGDPFYGAPLVIVVLDRKDAYCKVYDGSLAAGQMLLAADALGLGACWIHRAKQVFESEEGKKLLQEAGIQEEVEGIANIIVGYPDGPRPGLKPRKPGRLYRLG
ncbi:MAG: nitroreductase [Bacilli bacterium]|nr:nitroreductase [Bacilli bacterium]